MEKYIDKELCKACGGKCCKQNGCIYIPQDFEKLSFRNLKEQIDKGNISISGQPFNGFHGDGWSFLLYLRARNQGAKEVDLITSGGPCSLLTEQGCKLDENERPSLGLLLKPTADGSPCQRMYPQEAVLSWINYNNILSKLIKYYTNQEVMDVIIAQTTFQMRTIKEKIQALEDLKAMEKKFLSYYEIMRNKPYYTPEEAKLILSPKHYTWNPKR